MKLFVPVFKQPDVTSTYFTGLLSCEFIHIELLEHMVKGYRL